MLRVALRGGLVLSSKFSGYFLTGMRLLTAVFFKVTRWRGVGWSKDEGNW